MAQQADVTWVALECRIRQESPADEVYGTVAAIIPGVEEPVVHHFPAGGGTFSMGPPHQRVVNVGGVPLYSGPPVPIILTVHLIEHDSGNINEYKRRAAQAVAVAARSALAAAAATGGAAIALSALNLVIDDLSRGLVNAAAGALGVADDPYNPQSRPLDLATMADRPRSMLEHPPDPQQVEFTPLAPPPRDAIRVRGTDQGGDTGEYGFYFDVRVTGTPDTPTIETPPTPVRKVRILAAHSGKALDVKDFSMENSTPIIQFDFHGGNNQIWRLDDVGGGLFRIVSLHSGKVLDVKDSSMENSTPIVQFDWHGGNNQRWRLEDVGDGLSIIRSAHSGKVLDVDGASTDNSAPIVQFDFVDGLNQKWQLDTILLDPGDISRGHIP
jgi:hypothetical protein